MSRPTPPNPNLSAHDLKAMSPQPTIEASKPPVSFLIGFSRGMMVVLAFAAAILGAVQALYALGWCVRTTFDAEVPAHAWIFTQGFSPWIAFEGLMTALLLAVVIGVFRAFVYGIAELGGWRAAEDEVGNE